MGQQRDAGQWALGHRGWRDARKAGLALLALGLPFAMIMLFPRLGPACAEGASCEVPPPVALLSRGFVMFSAFWLPVLAVLAIWSRRLLVLLAVGGLSVAILTAVMTSPLSDLLRPLGLADLPVFAHFGISALIVGLLALADLRGR